MRVAVVLVVLVALVAVLLLVVLGRRPVGMRDIAWLADAPDASVEPDEGEVYRRYLTRHRTHRLVGGLLGVLLALVLGIRAYGEVRIGVGGGSPLADVLFCGLAGVLVGAFSAEAFRLSQPTSATVSA